MFRKRLSAAIALACSLTASSDANEPIKHRNVHKAIHVDGIKRTYTVHVPSGYDGGALPLVLILHGGLGNEFTSRCNSGMSQKADCDKFFAVYPNGTGRKGTPWLVWNAGECCGVAMRENVDDVAFIRKVIETMQREFKIDSRRIYVAGVSNGAMMAYRVGQKLSNIVAAIAPVAGCMQDMDANALGAVSVVAFHGTEDEIIPYSGGTGSMLGYKVHSKPFANSVDYWVRQNQCSREPVRSEHGTVVSETYSGGVNGTEVQTYVISGGSHSWPGSRFGFPIWKPPSKDISATDAMCEFFWKHPKRSDVVF